MPVELRKRKAPAEPAPPPPAKKKSNPIKAAVSKAKAAVTGKNGAPAANGASSTSTPTLGSTIGPEGFGGEVETNDGEKTTLKKLLDASAGGVVLFTYPKASTPGCTTQACLFRDDYSPLTATGFSIYGLSRDSPKANTTFKTKQNLPYPLLCDPSATLIGAIGLKKAPSGTTRGVFVVDKAGKVLAAEAGGPAATVEVVRKLLPAKNGTAGEAPATGPVATSTSASAPTMAEPSAMEGVETPAPAATAGTDPIKETAPVSGVIANGDAERKDDLAKAAVAADVADTAAKLDPATPNPA